MMDARLATTLVLLSTVSRQIAVVVGVVEAVVSGGVAEFSGVVVSCSSLCLHTTVEDEVAAAAEENVPSATAAHLHSHFNKNGECCGLPSSSVEAAAIRRHAHQCCLLIFPMTQLSTHHPIFFAQ